MSVQIELLEKNMAKLTIDVPAEDFDKAIVRAYNKNKNQISVPGFRKGKVPLVMIEKMYGASVFYEDAANDLLPGAYEQAAEESNLEIVSRPSIDVTQIEKGKDFIFTAEVAIKPEATLGAYKGVEVEKITVEVTDEDVEDELEKVQSQNSRLITVDRPAEDGDTVTIDYAGTVDGEPFEGGSDEGYDLKLGSGTFIPGFEDQLIGVSAGATLDVEVTFPEEYQAKELAGKDAVFACTVHEVKTEELPELDDEFAQDVSEFDTLEEYKEDLRKTLLAGKEADARKQKEYLVLEKIIADAQMEIPDPMIVSKAENMLDEYAQNLSYQGISLQQYYQWTGLTESTLLDQLKPQAVKNIQSQLVLEAVVKAEGIEISEEELDAEFKKMSETYEMEIEKIKEIFGEKEVASLKNDLATRKALDFVTDAAVEIEPVQEEPEPAEEAEAAPASAEESPEPAQAAPAEESPESAEESPETEE